MLKQQVPPPAIELLGTIGTPFSPTYRTFLPYARRYCLPVVAAIGFGVCANTAVFAASLQWDANGATPGTGGSGTWNTTTALWFNGVTFQAWSNAALDDAVFGGTAGTVTLGVPITAHDLTFDTSGYIVTGNTLTLGGASPTVSVLPGGTATIGSIIAGTAGLTEGGSGTLILTGNNTYTGGTTISSGTLQIGSGGTTGSIVGDILDNSALVFNRSNALTYAGTVSGSGSLTKSGAGVLTLTGDSTFVGGTTITAGTLQLGNGGTTGSIVGDVLDNGVLAINRSDAVTFGGVISGTGALTKSGTGVLTLTGDNTYTGTTTIGAGGTLQLGDGGTSGSVTGNIVDSSALVINRSDTLTYGGVISGAGTLAQVGTGTTILTGANTLTGGTTISSGTLQIGSGGTTGSIAGAIVDDSALVFNRSNTLTYAGVISGTGTLEQTGTGTLVLTGNSTYTGGTTISSGTLQVGSGANGSIVGDILDNSALVFNRSNALTYAGTVSGSGSLTKSGTGVLTLTGDSTYVGGTTISGGTLQLGNGGTTGSIVGDVLDNGILAINRSDAVTFAGTISGTGALTKSGAGVLTLTGDNTYTGTTTIGAGGTLQLGDGGTSGSVTGNIVDSSALVINRSNVLTYGGVISGAGTLDQAGTGTTILTGANTFTGGTTISSGTLQIGSGGTIGSIAGAIVDDSALVFNRSNTLTYAGVISGTGTLDQAGTGTLVLTGNSTYTGGTTISAGTLQVGSGANGSIVGDILDNSALVFNRSNALTYAGTISGTGALTKSGTGVLTLTGDSTYAGTTTISAGTLQLGSGGTTGSVIGNIVDSSALVINRSNVLTYGGVISGAGTLTQAGTGTTILTGANTYTGSTTISSGTLQIGNGGTTGSIAGSIIDNSALVFDRSNALTYAGVISGTGTLDQAGTGTTILTGANTYTGGTTISSGTLQIGNGGTAGSIVGNIVDDGVLAFNRSNALTYAGTISGSGSLTKSGAGVLTLTGDSTYVGGTTINAGTLQLGNGGTTGSIMGDVLDNGVLAINRSDAVTFGGVISGTGALTKSGTGVLTLTGDNTYTGTTTIGAGGTLQLGNGGTTGSVVGNIVDSSALVINRSDTLTYGGVISGTGTLTQVGTGTTILTGANTFTGTTTISSGTLHIGNGGTTGSIAGSIIDNSALVFDRSNALTYAGVISGTGTLEQMGTGTTILTGANTYTGGTTISSGTLQIGSGGTAGSIVGNIVDDGVLAFNRSNALTYAGTISGSGSLTKSGAGVLTLTGDSTFVGGTTITAGTLQLGNGGTTGSIVGDVLDNGVLAINRSDAVTFGGVISGTGALTKSGTGVLTLTGDNTYTGTTTIGAGGTLQLGDGGTSGSVTGNIVDSSALVINRSDTLTYGGVISGAGTLAQVGTGTTILTGANTLTGGTTISSGTLQIGSGGTTGSIAGAIVDDSALVFNRSNTLTYAGVISGTGTLEQTGTGTLVLTGNSTYTGGTTISSGTLQVGSGANGSIVGDILDNSALVFNRSNALTYAGTVSGSGSLTKSGTGVLTLTGDSTYVGGTTISGGTLQLGNGGTTGSIVGDVLDNGILAINRSDAVTFAGTISGTGALTKSGAGVLTLTGDNTYTGTTTIGAGGTLQLGDGGTSGSVTGNIVDSSALVINRSNVLTYGGVISGAGTLDQAGTGTTILTGANTFTGGTTISSGTLQIGSGGTIGSIAGAIVDDSALVFNRSNTLTYAGVISGTGTLDQAGTGTLVLTGNSTYTGGTTISAGTLQVGSGANGSIVGDILDNSALVFNRSNALTYAGTISGTGALTKSGTGVLTLTGDSTYAGTTTISAGTLQLGSGGTTGSVIGNIVDSSALVINRSNVLTYGGVISGAGTLTQAGTGTTILTGANTYTGSTTISSGTLQIGNGGTTGSIAGSIIDNSALVFDRSNALTYAGVISGSGSFTKSGAGVLTLTGDNTYKGGTTITAGTLQLGNGGTTGSVVGNIVDSSALVINRSNTLTYGGVISGTGTLDQAGTGTTILTGTNTYTGGTRIRSGTLQIGKGGTTGSVAGNIVDNSALAFNRSDVLTYGGVISGTGTLIQAGTGTTILTGANTFTGGTTISSGTLHIGNGGTTGSIVGNVINNGVFIFDRSDALTYAGVISGTGSLVKDGAGTLTLTGVNPYTGGTTVNAGSLVLNDAVVPGPVTALPHTVLSGTGTVGPTTIEGTLSPGHSIGKITVVGNLTFVASGLYVVEISPTAADRTDVTRTATLAGTVRVMVAPGNYAPGTTYTIINAAGGVNGTFAGLTSEFTSGFLAPELSYDATNVFLTIARNDTSFASIGRTPNQIATGGALDSLGLGNPIVDAVALETAGQARTALDLLSGEIHADVAGMMLDDSHYVRDVVIGRLRQSYGRGSSPLATLGPGGPVVASVGGAAPPYGLGYRLEHENEAIESPSDNRLASWGRALGAWGNVDSDGNAAALERSLGGLVAGLDMTFGGVWRLGLAGGYTQSSFDADVRASSGSNDNYHLALYGGSQLGPIGLRTGAAYSWSDIETARTIDVPGFFDHTTAEYDAGTAQLFGDVGYAIGLGRAALEPFAALAYVGFENDDFTESGGPAALTAASQFLGATFVTLGLRGAIVLALTHDIEVTARGALGWRHAFGDVTPELAFTFARNVPPFTIGGAPIAEESLVFDAGLDLDVGASAKLGFTYSGQTAHDARDHAVLGNLRVEF